MPPRKNRKPWQRGRESAKKQSIRRILILCEDEKSSRDYFAQFPVDPEVVEIECVGTGMNTDSLMENAIARKTNGNYEAIWVVYDKDDFSDQQFNRALDLARKHNDVYPCWSNECFELWYLLHFQYQNTGLKRGAIFRKLSELLGEGYDKADISLNEKLKDRLDVAIKNGEKLAFTNAQEGDPTGNPSTQVHELVKLLIDFDPDNC